LLGFHREMQTCIWAFIIELSSTLANLRLGAFIAGLSSSAFIEACKLALLIVHRHLQTCIWAFIVELSSLSFHQDLHRTLQTLVAELASMLATAFLTFHRCLQMEDECKGERRVSPPSGQHSDIAW